MIKNKSGAGLSRKFIFSLSLAYTVLIITSALIVSAVLRMNLSRCNEIISGENSRYYSGILGEIVRNASERGIKDTATLTEYLGRRCSGNESFLQLIVYERTGDENYFRVLKNRTLDSSIKPELKPGQIVSPEKGLDHMKAGLTENSHDPAFYTDGTVKWHNIYTPYRTEKKNLLIQARVSASAAEREAAILSRGSRIYRIIVFAISLVIAAGVIITTWLFYQSYSDILRGLASHLDRAARGNLDVRIKQSGDDELNRLADSFNSFIDCMRDRHSMTMETEEYLEYLNGKADSLFSEGVSLLKENRTDEASDKLRSFCIIRPESHPGLFNLAVAYARTGRYSEALDMFSRAIQIRPDHEMTVRYRDRVMRLKEKDE